MSTWISRSLALAALTVATGCGSAIDTGIFSGGVAFSRAAPDRIVVADRSVVIAGPPGYCVDTEATRDTGSGAFVLLGSCAAMSPGRAPALDAAPGLLTATVSSAGAARFEPSPDALETFFRSESGRAALSRSGDPDDVSILDVATLGDTFVVRARDTGGGASIAADYWRGIFDVKGRVITVSVVGFRDRPLSDTTARETLAAFAARIRAENAAPDSEV